MLTQNTGSAPEKDMPSTQDDHTNSVEQKKAELLKQETNKDLEITQDQLPYVEGKAGINHQV